MHPWYKNVKQLESVSFQSSVSANLTQQLESVSFQSPVSAYLTQSSCEESHIRLLEGSNFKKNFSDKRRKNLYLSYNKRGVVPDNASNNNKQKCVMHPWYKNVKQLGSVPSLSSASAHLATIAEDEEDLFNNGLNRHQQREIRHTSISLSHSQMAVQHKVLNYLKNADIDHVVLRNLCGMEEGEYFFDSARKILFLINSKTLSKWILGKYSSYSVRKVEKKDFKLYFVRPKMEAQGLFDALGEMFQVVGGTTRFLVKAMKNYNNPQVLAWIIDVLTLTLELNDPLFWSPLSMLKFLARLYSLVMRFSDFKNSREVSTYQTQSLDEINGVDSIMLLLTCFGLPEPIMKGLKQISLVTNKKVLDSPNIIMDLIQKFLEVCFDLLTWLKATLKIEIVDVIIELLVQPLNFVKGIKLTKDLSKLTIEFQKNNQIIFDPVVRVKCMDLYKDIKTNVYIQSLLVNPAYRIYAQQFSTLEIMNKLSSNFDVSARNEPVCFVFEGKAGCGKSTLMNKVVDYLVRKSYSIYNHSCPSVDAGKDFYDNYLDQDIFVMDDVGQQGVSQWRQIINFVSPVKFPLECAEAKLKNTKYFNSKLLLLTTNHFSDLHSFTKSDCIAEPEALFRRCHVLNFDKAAFIKGKMEGSIQYKKFDYLSHSWVETFIGPQSDCKLNAKCELENDNKTVAWVSSLIMTFLDKQDQLFNNNKLNEDDEVEIDSLVNCMLYGIRQDEFVGNVDREYAELETRLGELRNYINDTYLDTVETQSFSSLLSDICSDNIEIFRDYFAFLKTHFIENTILVYETIKNTLSEDTYTSAAMKGALKGLAGALVAYAAQWISGYFLGDANSDTLTIDSFRQQSVKTWYNAHAEYVNRTIPSAIIDNSNDTLMEIVHRDQELGTRISSLRSKMRIVELISKTGFKNVAQGIVSGRRIVVQCHSYNTMEGVGNIFRDWNCYNNNSYECNNIPFKVIKEWPEYDMSIIEIDLVVPIYKDATHSLFTKDLDLDVSFNARKMYFVNAQAALSLDNNFTVNMDSFQVQSSVVNKTYTVMAGAGIEYSITAPGLCGSLLVDAEHGLCGLHVAGNSENGFAFVLPKRILRELKTLLTFRESQHLEIKENVDSDYSGLKLYNDLFQAKRPLQKTSLNKSELHDVLTSEIEQVGEKLPPNFLSHGTKTLSKIAEKSLKPIPYIPDEAIQFGKKCIRRFFVKFDDLTDHEVIKGIKEDELSGLNKLSVNGFGYEKDKNLYIDFDRGEITDEFENRIRHFREDCKNDTTNIKDLLFYEAFKDELRMEEKRDKPRSFRVAPLHHTFLVKKCLGKLFAHCKKNMWENQMAIGMNPYKHWNTLYKKLKTSFINFDGDFGNWDGGAPAQVQDAISEMVLEFYKGEDMEVLKVLLNSMVRTFVLIKEKVVLTTHSMPSGCWVTAFFNSLINRFLTAMVLYTEMSKKGLTPTVEDFDEIVDFVMGDDKICGASERLSVYFNAITMRNFAHSIGMKYTDGEKGEITEISKPLSDCVFLKRGFRLHSQLHTVVGPLSLTTLINSLRYKDSSRDYDEIMGGKMTAFQFEMFLHENEELKEKIMEAARNSSFYFTEFSDEHISKTMKEDDTYAMVMKSLGKVVSTYS